MKLCLAILTIGTCVSVALAQYDGPLPPRPVIPGAAPVGGPRPALRRRPVARVLDETPQIRRQSGKGAPRRLPPPLLEQSLQARPVPSNRDYDETPVRRQSIRAGPRRFPVQEQPLQPRALPSRPIYQESPISVVRAPVLTQSQHVPIRPVVEDEGDDDEEDEYSTFATPSPTPPNIPFAQPTQPPQQIPQQFSNLNDFPVPTRQQYRPQQQQQQFTEEEPQPQPQPQPQFVRQPRPQQIAPARQQAEPARQEPARPKPYAQQQYNRAQQVARPAQKEVAHTKSSEPSDRRKKPTSQVLKKYRDDNPDGSITWGYENDDGSFKEETIGVDCVTYGKYGYVDPDGVTREFSYTSGIPCDKTKQEDSETQASEGYIDYTNNRYVFPNGATIDLNDMVRNRARKPVYRN